MRTAEDMNEHLLDELQMTFRVLGMFVSNSKTAADVQFRRLFHELAYLQEREDEYKAAFDSEYESRGLWLATGFRGPLQNAGIVPDTYMLAALYARVAYRMGWLKVERVFTPQELDELRTWARHTATANTTCADAIAHFGEFSLTIVRTRHAVDTRGRWVNLFFQSMAPLKSTDEHHLQMAWLPTPKVFARGVIKYGDPTVLEAS